MSMAQTFIGGGFVVGIATAFTQVIAPDPTFLTVHEVSYSAGQITAKRTVNDPHTIADWRVTIVGRNEYAPTCQTVPGNAQNEGWSRYEAGYSETTMSVDEWVGQAGCYDQLTPGPYDMFVNWTPRDGRPPAYKTLRFVK